MDSSLSAEAFEFVRHSLKSSDITVIPLAGDASSRRYYRLVKDDRSWVLMVWEPFSEPDRFPFLSVQRHFKKHGVHVPEVVDFSSEKGVILLEDLGDLTLERKVWENQNQDAALPFYFMAIDELIKIHFPATADHRGPCSAFEVEFDVKKLLWEMNYGREHVIERLNRVSLSPAARSTLDDIFTDICTRLHEEPKHICHRDYHSRNLMIKLGKMRVIDFQDARMGPVQYDLVSLVYDSYVNLSEATRSAILNYYLDKASPHLGRDYNRSHFQDIMAIQVLQRCFKACGSFASFYNLRADLRYIKYIQPTLKTVALFLQNFTQYQGFLNILTDEGLLDRKYEDLCTP